MRTLLIVCSLLLVAPASVLGQGATPSMAGRSTVYAPNGVVAASQPIAASAGLAVLQRGGNAIDAAVATAAVLSVVEPMMTGIGGDMFAIVWLADEERLVGINASGRAGSLATPESFSELGLTRIPSHGATTVTVPGALSGWAALLDAHGTITLAAALQPAIDLAQHGFPVTPVIADFWAERLDMLSADEGARSTFLLDGVRPPSAGDWFENPDYASTLRLIANDGPEVLYNGSLGERIVRHLGETGGFLTMDDLRAHTVEWIDPISVPYRGYRVWEMPPSGQGIAVLEMLRILEAFDLRSMGHNSVEYLHHLIEAKKLAFADLAGFVADPDHMTTSPDVLLGDAFIDARRTLIDARRANLHSEPGRAHLESETVYVTAADRHGNMVSLINSNAGLFGSGVVVPGTGFVLQNRGVGFTLEEDHPNTLAPGKRPFHTIIPGFVTRPVGERMEPWLSFGVMGGPMQPQGHVQLLLNLIDFEMDPQEAADAARFQHVRGMEVALEPAISPTTRDGLSALGHELIESDGVFFGGAQLIMRLDRGWAAASEPRQDGVAVGH